MKFVMFLGIYIEMKNHFRIQKNLDKSRFLISNYYSPTYDNLHFISIIFVDFWLVYYTFDKISVSKTYHNF